MRYHLTSARMHVRMLSCFGLFVTSWTIAHQAPLSWDFPSKNIRVGCHFLLQGIFLMLELNLRLQCHFLLQGIFLMLGLNLRLQCLLHWQADSLPLSHLGSPLAGIATNNKSWRGCGERKSLLRSWWECKLVNFQIWKTEWKFLKELKIEVPYDPAIPIQGIYPNRIII